MEKETNSNPSSPKTMNKAQVIQLIEGTIATLRPNGESTNMLHRDELEAIVNIALGRLEFTLEALQRVEHGQAPWES